MATSRLNIKRLLSKGIGVVRSNVLRKRYRRGHGVHSPFVYSIVRGVFMFKELKSSDKSFYKLLLEAGFEEYVAKELHNLCVHCHYKTLAVNSLDAELCVFNSELSTRDIANMVDVASDKEINIVLVAPYANHQRELMCVEIIAQHKCTTVDNKKYLLIFNNHLPKQHFKI